MLNIVKVLVLGALLGWSFVLTLGYTNAITAPKSLFEFFSIGDSPILAIILWDIFVVYGLGIGLMLFVTGFSLARVVPDKALKLAVVTLVSVWLTSRFGYDWVTSGSSLNPFNRPWWQYSFELVMVLSIFVPIIAHAKRRKPV